MRWTRAIDLTFLLSRQTQSAVTGCPTGRARTGTPRSRGVCGCPVRLRACLAGGNHSPEVHWHIIRCLVGEQKFGLAEEESYRLLNEHPEMTPVFVTLAQIAFLTEDYPLAIDHATKAISQGVRMADACFIRAYAHARLGNFNVALANIKVSLAESNRETEFRAEAPYLLHGAILKQLQQHRDALLAYERALRVNENSTDALLGQWDCYQQLQMAPAPFLVAEEMLRSTRSRSKPCRRVLCLIDNMRV
ncbi:MAG: tetratricopeptide repeat protein [Planctomycetaceae bacterium]